MHMKKISVAALYVLVAITHSQSYGDFVWRKQGVLASFATAAAGLTVWMGISIARAVSLRKQALMENDTFNRLKDLNSTAQGFTEATLYNKDYVRENGRILQDQIGGLLGSQDNAETLIDKNNGTLYRQKHYSTALEKIQVSVTNLLSNNTLDNLSILKADVNALHTQVKKKKTDLDAKRISALIQSAASACLTTLTGVGALVYYRLVVR